MLNGNTDLPGGFTWCFTYDVITYGEIKHKREAKNWKTKLPKENREIKGLEMNMSMHQIGECMFVIFSQHFLTNLLDSIPF